MDNKAYSLKELINATGISHLNTTNTNITNTISLYEEFDPSINYNNPNNRRTINNKYYYKVGNSSVFDPNNLLKQSSSSDFNCFETTTEE